MYFYWHKQKNLDECYLNKLKKNFIAPFYGDDGNIRLQKIFEGN